MAAALRAHRIRSALLCVSLCALPALADPGPAYLVKDIDAGLAGFPEHAPEFFGPIRDMGDVVYLPVYTPEAGVELWRSDGTAAGTALVADQVPGARGSSPIVFGSVGGTVLYRAEESVFVGQLWRSDGTAAGTSLVADVQPGFESVTANGAIYFSADDGVHGRELWRSDGTSAGTVMVADIQSGPGSSDPRYLAAVNGIVFFAAGDGVHTELWKSDGTGAGTAIVKDIFPGAQSSSPADLTVVGATLFFSADGGVGRQLWKSDGTGPGTVAVQDPTPGPIAQSPDQLVNAGGTLYFAVNSGADLWKSDGTSAGTVQVATVPAYYGLLFEVVAVGSRLFFWTSADSIVAELWTSDGTSAGTVSLGALGVINDFGEDPYSTLFYLTDRDGTLFFAASRTLAFPPNTGDVELWKSDGTTAGTVRVKDLQPGSAGSLPTALANVDGELWFSAEGPGGRQLWRSDGTDAGTSPITEFAWTRSSDPARLTDVNGTLMFVPTVDPVAGDREPWKSDGTTAGTVRLKDIRPGTASSIESPFFSTSGSFVNVNGTAFFRANDGTSGAELWKSDGTEAGTVRVKDIIPGAGSGDPLFLVNVNGTLFFRARESATGYELWKSDGTSAGTVLVKDIAPGSADANPHTLTNVNGTLFFSTPGNLWKSDGTSAGTVLVAPRGIDTSLEGSAANANGVLFFSNLGDLWKSDGTSAGTVMLKEFAPDTSFRVRRITPVGSSVFFLGRDAAHGWELWKSDGTPAGTVIVKDIAAGPLDLDWVASNPMAVVGDTVFLGANDGVNGKELWKSDGTESGTVIVKEMVPGPGDAGIGAPVAVGSAVVFRGWSEAFGDELWATDGTAQNTHMVADLAPGSLGSSPIVTLASGSRVFFQARLNATGSELFAVPIAALMDSDLDGLDFAAETAHGTDPFRADTDSDGLSDGAEVLTHGTDPLDGDSDGDGFGDSVEVAAGTDPLDPGDFPAAVPLMGPWGLGVLAALIVASARRRA